MENNKSDHKLDLKNPLLNYIKYKLRNLLSFSFFLLFLLYTIVFGLVSNEKDFG